MEHLKKRPEDKEREPELYEVIAKTKEGIAWTGVRISSEFKPYAEHMIQPPFLLVPITFRDKVYNEVFSHDRKPVYPPRRVK